jgi:ABC-type nitrate/sulfonate/bicarbonate transport system ATPase subunit
MTASPVVVNDLQHSFGDLCVLSDFRLDVAAGEFIAIVGPSGCGKSTLLRILSGLVEPESGSLFVNGIDVAGDPGTVAYLPQGDSLLPWKRALDNASLGLEVAGVSRTEARSRAQVLFSAFGLGGFERSWPHELSGGMRQRVAVLRTFLLPHSVLGLDEPFGALDALTRRTMQSWLRSVWLQDRRTTLLITHDVEEALLLADRVVVMSPRPGTIAATFVVEDMNDRSFGVETSETFVALKRNILEVLRGQLEPV